MVLLDVFKRTRDKLVVHLALLEGGCGEGLPLPQTAVQLICLKSPGSGLTGDLSNHVLPVLRSDRT